MWNGNEKLLRLFLIYVLFYQCSCVFYAIAMQYHIINTNNTTPTKHGWIWIIEVSYKFLFLSDKQVYDERLVLR